jgi:hypothetical protein
MKRRTRLILVWSFVLITCLAVGVVLRVRYLYHYTPVEAIQDVKAGIAARNAPEPVTRFLELRYGSLTEPENRQKAFLDFFNIGHIKGLQYITSHLPEAKRKEHTAAMARWVASYRRQMTPAEKAALRTSLGADGGKAIVQAATAQYLSQDVHYRATTAPVITELLTTLTEIQKP